MIRAGDPLRRRSDKDTWSGLVVAVIAVALAVTWLVPALRGAGFGLVERCWYAATILWLALTAIGLILS